MCLNRNLLVSDLKQLLEGPHSIDKKHISVMRKPPNKKVPLDRLKVHVQGLNETTSEDCLRFYLEKFSTAEVSEVYRGCRNNALAVFDADPGNCHSFGSECYYLWR